MDGSQNYNLGVRTKNGYTLIYPNVGIADDLIQDDAPNPYAESATQLFPLGTRLIRGEEEWRYCRSNATGLATIGTTVQSAAAVHAEQADDIVVGAASAIGSYSVWLTSTDNLDGTPNNVDNTFAEGYLIVNDAAGEGQMYKIKSNKAFDASESVVEFVLYDPLTVALTTSSQVGIVMCPYSLTLATTAPMTGMFLGVNQIAVTASYYYWIKWAGPAPVNAHEAFPTGATVVTGITAAKADTLDFTSTMEVIIGVAMTPGVTDTEKCMVNLRG